MTAVLAGVGRVDGGVGNRLCSVVVGEGSWLLFDRCIAAS